jgi:V8-like Glu-specific endopeptidase
MIPQNLTPADQLTYSTVKITCHYTNGTIGYGTGFVYSFFKINPKEGVFGIVTNKHVVDNAVKISYVLSTLNHDNTIEDTKHFVYEFSDIAICRVDHPMNEVDLCVLLVPASFSQSFIEKGVNPFSVMLDSSIIYTGNDLTTLEDVIMIGYPNAIWDDVNNKPIVRKGITATHPCKDYKGKKEFMIDMACFPGSSGSPVFLYNPTSYFDNRGTIVVGSRIKLLGILYAGPLFTAEGEIAVQGIPTGNLPVRVNTMLHLGNVIKASRINEIRYLIDNKKALELMRI